MLAEGERLRIVQLLENFPACSCVRPTSPPPLRAPQAAHRPRSNCFCIHACRPLLLESHCVDAVVAAEGVGLEESPKTLEEPARPVPFPAHGEVEDVVRVKVVAVVDPEPTGGLDLKRSESRTFTEVSSVWIVPHTRIDVFINSYSGSSVLAALAIQLQRVERDSSTPCWARRRS